MTTTISGFRRIKEGLSDKEWHEFFCIAKAIKNVEKLRYLNDLGLGLHVDCQKSLPVFATNDEIKLLYLAKKGLHALPEWLQPHVEAAFAAIEHDRLKQSELSAVRWRQLEMMLGIDWFPRSIGFDYQQAYDHLSSELPGQETTIAQVLDALHLFSRGSGGHFTPILLVGPPGTAKTTLISKLATLLNRNFAKVQFASITDPISIQGSPFHYGNSLPGCIWENCFSAKSADIVFLFDEICEIFRTQSEANRCGMALLDFLENGTFRDEFFGFQAQFFPLIFMTANSIDQVPEKLVDRCKVIHIKAYSVHEKQTIIQRVLWPYIQQQFQLDGVRMSAEAARELVYRCRREAGARSIRTGCYDLAAYIAKLDPLPDEIKPAIVRASVQQENPKRELQSRIGCATMLGIVNGIGVTDNVYVRCLADDSAGTGLQITGMPENDARESIQQAVLLAQLTTHRLDNRVFVQMGALSTPKAGASAGLATFAAAWSAFAGVEIRGDYAFTGVVDIDGSVSVVDGIDEKVRAAEELGCTKVFLPFDCMPEDPGKFAIELVPVCHVNDLIKRLSRTEGKERHL